MSLNTKNGSFVLKQPLVNQVQLPTHLCSIHQMFNPQQCCYSYWHQHLESQAGFHYLHSQLLELPLFVQEMLYPSKQFQHYLTINDFEYQNQFQHQSTFAILFKYNLDAYNVITMTDDMAEARISLESFLCSRKHY